MAVSEWVNEWCGDGGDPPIDRIRREVLRTLVSVVACRLFDSGERVDGCHLERISVVIM